MTDTHSIADNSSTRRLLSQPPTDEQAAPSGPSPPSLWQKLKAENEAQKARRIVYVTPQEAEQMTGYGEGRVEREEEKREVGGKKERGGLLGLLGILAL